MIARSKEFTSQGPRSVDAFSADAPVAALDGRSAEVLDVRRSRGEPPAKLTAEMVRRLIIDGKLGPGALAGSQGDGPLRPLCDQQHLVPFGLLAQKVLRLYRDTGTGAHDFVNVGLDFLTFAGGRVDVPGLAVVHLVLYFAHRGPDPFAAVHHLLAALALEQREKANASLGPILNDLGVMLLLHMSAPRAAVQFFKRSVLMGFVRTDAGLANLQLLHRTASEHGIDLPGLHEALQEAEKVAGRFDPHLLGNHRCTSQRPDPQCENWAWYLDGQDVSPPMLHCAGDKALLNRHAASLASRALSQTSGQRAAPPLAAAAEALPELKPLADLTQDRLEAERNAQYQADRHQTFLAALDRARAALRVGDLDQEHVGRAFAAAPTQRQKRQVEFLAGDFAHAKAMADKAEGYDLADSVAVSRAKHTREIHDVAQTMTQIDHLLGEQQFLRALEVCQRLALFETVPRQTIEANRGRVLAQAECKLRERVRDSLTPSDPDLAAAEKAVGLARQLRLAAKFCDALRDQITVRKEEVFRSQFHALLAGGSFDPALDLLNSAAGEIAEQTIQDLTQSLVAFAAAAAGCCSEGRWEGAGCRSGWSVAAAAIVPSMGRHQEAGPSGID